MSPALLLAALFAALMAPPLSHVLFGAMGGLAHPALRYLDGERVRRGEWFARVFFGAVGAAILTVVLQLPNHLNSLFVGYFAVDLVRKLLPAMRARAEKLLGIEPSRPEPPAPPESPAARPPDEP